MDKKYDFNGIGKRLPYKAPDNLLDEMEANVMSEVKRIPAEVTAAKAVPGHVGKWTAFAGAALAIAAAIVLLLVLDTGSTENTDISDIEEAFARLDEADQAYLLDVYENDLFINGI